MNKKLFFSITAVAFLCGMIFFGVMKEWIIIAYPTHKTVTPSQALHAKIDKKNVTLFFWHTNKWHTEIVTLLWSSNTTDNVFLLINNWLTLLDEEHVMDKRVTLQTAIAAPSDQHLYLSFDRNPLPLQKSTHDKLMWLESLLKTVRENEPSIQEISFLVHHQPLSDDHLDFSNPWPIDGFLK